MRRFALPGVLCAWLLAHVAAAHAEWIVDAGGGMVYEDNLTRATRQADRRSDIAFAPALSVGHYFQLTDAMNLLATADFKGRLYAEFFGVVQDLVEAEEIPALTLKGFAQPVPAYHVLKLKEPDAG